MPRNGLAASGLLDQHVGGPSVFPPAPAYLFQWPFSSSSKPWNESSSPDKYRRALYTFRYRSVAYPALRVFDAPSGEFAVVGRTRSNTPLQALTTLNEPLFVECAKALAPRTHDEGGASDRDRLRRSPVAYARGWVCRRARRGTCPRSWRSRRRIARGGRGQ